MTTTTAPTTSTERETILVALDAWIRQRPGLDFRNYARDGSDTEGRAAYFSELRSITKDLHDARALLAYVRYASGITAEMLRESFDAFSGRLTWTPSENGGTLDYTTGQYWPTEYRKAACAVLASACWKYFRENVPEAQREGWTKSYGEQIRDAARRELGAPIARRWFR